MELYKVECPNCGAKELAPDESGQLACAFCHSTFGEVTHVCPSCGTYNEEQVRFCEQCGSPLIRDCPVCGADNWILAEHCIQCGRSLDLIEQMARRWQLTTQQRLQEWKGEVAQVKAVEEKASEQRMASLLEAERIRQEALALARATQRKRDRQLYVWLIILVAVFVVIAVFFLVLSSIGS
jgi:ribosomal protein S27AE